MSAQQVSSLQNSARDDFKIENANKETNKKKRIMYDTSYTSKDGANEKVWRSATQKVKEQTKWKRKGSVPVHRAWVPKHKIIKCYIRWWNKTRKEYNSENVACSGVIIDPLWMYMMWKQSSLHTSSQSLVHSFCFSIPFSLFFCICACLYFILVRSAA